MDNSLPEVDLVIIGGGPVGMFSAFYGGMRQMSVRLIESMPQLGGQLTALYPEKYIYDIPGFTQVTAQKFVDHLQKQLEYFAPQIHLQEKVLHINKLKERLFKITTNKTVYFAKAILIACGAGSFTPRRLNLPEADQFEGTNLHYFVNELEKFRNRRILIAGGGDSALDWALMLEPFASEIFVVHRRAKFRAHEHTVQQVLKSQVRLITPAEITNLHGTTEINSVTLTHKLTDKKQQIAVDEVIISHGFTSTLGAMQDWGIQLADKAIVVNSHMETTVSGIFAAGDITTYEGKFKLIAVGLGEAPQAVNNAKVYVDPEAKHSAGHSSNMER